MKNPFRRKPMMTMKVYAATDMGLKRTNNEDSFEALSGTESPG
jgi:serine/threonine protein phosphatase PrpC